MRAVKCGSVVAATRFARPATFKRNAASPGGDSSLRLPDIRLRRRNPGQKTYLGITGDELIASATVATGARDLSGRGQLSQA